ncbi:MAG: glycoside hydrolase family 2 protein [Planctomycetota bacterium]|jgi:hypothetical protein
MPLARAIAPLTLMLATTAAVGQDRWPPTEAPIMTRWAADVSPERVHAEYPRPQLVRDEWLNLNGLWELDFAEEGQPPPIGRSLSRRILVPFPVESALSGVMRHGNRLWYRRTFDVPPAWRDRRLRLHFGAVDWHARVWINGVFVGEHRGGYDAFMFDVTDALKEGNAQEVIVGVWDPTDDLTQPRGKQVRVPQGIWYTPSTGIWQTVWLEPVPERRLDRVELIPDVDNARLRVKLPGATLSRSDAVDVVVFEEGREIARASGLYEIEVPLETPRLWSPDDPFLYDVEITLRWWNDPARVLDRVRSYFGMRNVDVGPDDEGTMRLRLNGRPLFQIGTLDQGFWPDGLYTAPTDEALRYDVEVTKQLGFNAIRKHVKVEPDRWYFWCDRLGLLVWQDMPSGDAFTGNNLTEIQRSPGSAAQFERELTRLIEGRRNHPCIVTWVLFNEGWGQYDTAGLTGLIRSLDPTRPVDSASGWNDLGTGDVLDIHSYPGPACPPAAPPRAAVLGEFGGLGLPVEGHTWTDTAWGYRSMPDAEALVLRYERLLRAVWELRETRGLAAAFYTQITDVETECNGLLTYDRAVIKADVARIAAANQGRLPRLVPLVPTAKRAVVSWRYTFSAPPTGWEQTGFDDSAWPTGAGGFGRKGTPGAVVRTPWTGPDIWLRSTFVLRGKPARDLVLYLHHDEDAQIYIDGVLAASVTGYTTTYEEVEMSPDALATLRSGSHVLAVHCRQTSGGQYIDVGLARLEAPD